MFSSRCQSKETTKFAKVVALFQESHDIHLASFEFLNIFFSLERSRELMNEMKKRRNFAPFINSFSSYVSTLDLWMNFTASINATLQRHFLSSGPQANSLLCKRKVIYARLIRKEKPKRICHHSLMNETFSRIYSLIWMLFLHLRTASFEAALGVVLHNFYVLVYVLTIFMNGNKINCGNSLKEYKR